MDFGYIHGKRAHFRDVIVAVSDFQELNDRYWGANNYKGKLGQRQNFWVWTYKWVKRPLT